MDFHPPDSPVQDHLKPDLPYVPGATLEIQQCQPHVPFGISFQDEASRTYHWNPALEWKTASRLCIQNPPLKGKPIANPKERTIIIDSQIACGDGRGAQLVKCHYAGSETPIVAKIYDPLYYLWRDTTDPAYEADEHFTTEAAVYMTLQDMDKDYTVGYPRVRDALEESIPRYYGSYTWQTQLLDGQRRDVRLILMEYIPFPSMWSMLKKKQVESIPPKRRMQLLARVLEIFPWLEYYGIDQNDFAPRNIMVDPDQGRVVVLDFSTAKIRDLYNSEWFTFSDKPLPAAPMSPVEYWGCQWGDDLEGWVSENVHGVQARYNWFFNQWGDSKVFQPLSVIWHHHHKQNMQREIAKEKRMIGK